MAEALLPPFQGYPEGEGIGDWPRVTEVIKATLAAPELVEFSYYQAIDIVAGLVYFLRNGGDERLDDDDAILDVIEDADWIREVLAENKMTARDVLRAAADVGEQGHEYLASLATVSLESGPDTAHDMAVRTLNGERNHKYAIAQWWIDSEPDVVFSERPVWSHAHRFRGTLDLFWINKQGRWLITDLKNRKANKPCVKNHKTPEAAANCHEVGAYNSDFVQTGGYAIALAEMLLSDRALLPGVDFNINGRTILVARADGTYGEYSADHVDQSTFLSVLDVYRQLRAEEVN